MQRQTIAAVLLAAVMILAGCAGSTTPGGPTADDGPTDGTMDGATGTVEFYVSDQPATIDEFEHLNVTITRIGFQRAESGEDDSESEETEGEETDGEETDSEETADETESEDTDTETTSTTETQSDGGAQVAPQQDGPPTDAGPPGDGPPDEESTESGTESGDAESEGDDDRAGWETVDVDSRTVDLTRLKGDNATLVGTPEIPAGNYTKVFVYVSDINATLDNGESVNVKLPSQKLQLNKGFTLEPNGTVEFVYDIAVVKAGNSGKYILKPVISQSGTDQEIDRVDEDEREEDDEDEAEDEETEAKEEETDEEETEEEETDEQETEQSTTAT